MVRPQSPSVDFSREWLGESAWVEAMLAQQEILQKKYERTDLRNVVPLDADKYFADADFTTKQPYITFLKKGGFKAFPTPIPTPPPPPEHKQVSCKG